VAPLPGPSAFSSSPTTPTGAPMPMNLQKSMAKWNLELWAVDSGGCLRGWTSWYSVRPESGTFGACEEGWPIAEMKSLEGSQFVGVVVLTTSGGIHCKSATYCTDSVNEHGVGKVPYPNQAADPAVQVALGPENMLLLTASGKVMVMGQTRFGVVQPNFNGISKGTLATEMKPVFGLPDPGVNPAVQVGIKNGYGGYSAGVLTASGELWSWGDRATRFAFPSSSNSEVPRTLQGLPVADAFIIDFMMGGYHFLLLRTSQNKVYGAGGTSSGANGCPNGQDGPCEITDRIPGLDTDPVSHYMAAYYASWIVLTSGKIYTLGTDDKCGARGLGINSGQDSGSHHPDPEPITSSLPSGSSAVELGGDVNSPYAVLMTSGEIYVWGWWSVQEQSCLLRGSAWTGTPTPRLVDQFTALLPQASTPSAGGAGAGASAVGDPHLQNIHGERFDLMKAGKHVLIHVPRGAAADSALLRVQADARRVGGQCADMYFQKLNVTGSWAEAKQAGGCHYSVSERDTKAPKWVAFGKVELKVVHGRTDSGFLYLNLYVKHLGRAGFAVGGLLGEDDHEDVSAAPESCAQRLALVAGTHRDEGQALSFAVASLA